MVLEILMHTTRNMDGTTNLFANLTYSKKKILQAATQLYGLEKSKSLRTALSWEKQSNNTRIEW